MAEFAVMVIDPGGNRIAHLVNDQRTTRDLIPILVARFGLPAELMYQLVPAGHRQGLYVDDTLARSGVGAGAVLYLVPNRDSLYTTVLDRLYAEARQFVAEQLWDLARERLDKIFRTNPDYPDVARLLDRIAPHVIAEALPGRPGARVDPAAGPGAAATAGATAAAAGGGGGLALLLVLVVGGAVVYANREKIEKWWDKQVNGKVAAPPKAPVPDPFANPALPPAVPPGDEGRPATQPKVYGLFVVGGNEVHCGEEEAIKRVAAGRPVRLVGQPLNSPQHIAREFEAQLIPGSFRDVGRSGKIVLLLQEYGRFRFDGGAREYLIIGRPQ
jgi:hypothetical protein